MSNDHGPRTVAERYSCAIDSSHLDSGADYGDVDLLIAAGWSAETLGAMLYRLRAEFDSVRGDYRLARRNLTDAQGVAERLAREARVRRASNPLDPDAAKIGDRVRTMVRQARAAAATAHALALIRLKSLDSAKAALQSYAVAHATRSRFMEPDTVVAQVVGRALELWLDPNCPHCHGRGHQGDYTVGLQLCPRCGGSGRRRAHLGETRAQHDFGHSLLVEMDRKTETVERQMIRFLRTR